MTKEKNRIVYQGDMKIALLDYIKYDILYRLLLKTIRPLDRYRVQKKKIELLQHYYPAFCSFIPGGIQSFLLGRLRYCCSFSD